ncbi:MAG TPA: glycerol-3-phosphate transporter [Coxiellaceae bacterium]|nr:glycerol-3-phosphate transporter [Coxiellaceae bacterium]
MLKYLQFFRSAPHIACLPDERIDAHYKKLRWKVFAGIFIGYTSFYFLRNNFSLAIPYLEQQGFTKTQLGFIFSAFPLAYGFSKFIMGILSDRSNPRYFMATGLFLSALLSFAFGTNLVLSSLSFMLVLMFLNGWVQGMGGPASARVMAHWFTSCERGTMMSAWSTAQNIGGGIIGPLAILGLLIFTSWHSIFYFPAMFALVAVFLVLLFVRDTPQSEGLPPIEEYRKGSSVATKPVGEAEDSEKELTTKEVLIKYVLCNKYLWYLALANVFVYLVRYGVINWTPSYLTQVKGYSHNASRWAYFLYEYAAIPGIILCGWISDKFFHGRRAPICMIYMAVVTVGILFYWLMPGGHPVYNNIALVAIGFFVYGPVTLIGINAVDLVPKKAVGAAFGFVGLCGYIGGAMMANVGIGFVVDYFGWNGGFIMLLSSSVLAVLFLILSSKPRLKVTP